MYVSLNEMLILYVFEFYVNGIMYVYFCDFFLNLAFFKRLHFYCYVVLYGYIP